VEEQLLKRFFVYVKMDDAIRGGIMKKGRIKLTVDQKEIENDERPLLHSGESQHGNAIPHI
jgi:hypothetical protein